MTHEEELIYYSHKVSFKLTRFPNIMLWLCNV